jgi:hypothetical protein
VPSRMTQQLLQAEALPIIQTGRPRRAGESARGLASRATGLSTLRQHLPVALPTPFYRADGVC